MTLQEMISRYKKNYYLIQDLESLLHSGDTFEQWLDGMQKRAKSLQEAYYENNEILSEIREYEWKPFESNEEAIEVYDLIYQTYKEYIDDPELLLPPVRKLITYFEANKDKIRLLHLYYIAMYEINEMECRGTGSKADLTYQMKILDYKKDYRSFGEDERSIFFSVYYHLSSVCLGMESVTPQEAYYWYKEAKEFFYSDVVHPIDKDTPKIVEAINQIRYDFINEISDADKLSNEAITELYDLITELYEKEMEESGIYGMDSYVYSSYLEMEYRKGKYSLREIIDLFMEFYRFNVENFEDKSGLDYFYMVIECPNTIEHWVSKYEDTFYGKLVIDELTQTITTSWEQFKQNTEIPAPFLHQILADWCQLTLKYTDTREKKEKAIYDLIVSHQVPTYLHSNMVMRLAEKYFEMAYRKRPDLFRSLHMNYDELLEFVKKSALIHDIGKTKIVDVINRQGRKLSTVEFSGIKKHPEFGAKMIEKDKDLSIYRDIILYHHKYYDGSEGYPYGDGNTKSPYRIIIDLITICDCVDAATDSLGRNYKHAKTMKGVLMELLRDMGIRYNPDLVNILNESPRLIHDFEVITDDNRAHLMYEAYRESKTEK